MSRKAIGLIETKGLIPAVEATDVALKAANVTFVGMRNPGSGLASITIEGDVAAVRAATDAGAAAASRIGEVVSVQVLSRPHDELAKLMPAK
ncbi:MAG: BMC domain-containing protein [Planctomycetes bacterium]|nr:BMC domain-containing protein [Planctomycetota bacterium]